MATQPASALPLEEEFDISGPFSDVPDRSLQLPAPGQIPFVLFFFSFSFFLFGE